jgi:uncharacterized membrane protein
MACAAAVAVCLWLLAGSRALWFALAPTLLIYGTVNWDLLAVALTTMALVTFAARRDGWTGLLLGLGASAKFYPALVLLPLILQALQDREPDRSVRLAWWSAGTWVAVNLPFAAIATRNSFTPEADGWNAWLEFFSFNAERPPDFDSLWYIACERLDVCIATSQVNLGSFLLFVAIAAGVFWWKAARQPDFPRWTFAVPLLIAFLVTNKVYSPQYGLWLLPWFALTMPRLRRFVAFEVADVAVFVTRFWFFGTYTGTMSLVDEIWFQIAVLARAGVLIWCLVAWAHEEQPQLVLGQRGWSRAPAPIPAVMVT